MNKLLQWASHLKKALAAASAAMIVTGEVFSDGVLTGEWFLPTGEVLTLLTAWLSVFGVYWFSNGVKPSER